MLNIKIQSFQQLQAVEHESSTHSEQILMISMNKRDMEYLNSLAIPRFHILNKVDNSATVSIFIVIPENI